MSFREKEELAEKIELAAVAEDLATADFVRKIFRIGFREYQAAGSLHEVRIRADLAADVTSKAGRAVATDQRAARAVSERISGGPKKKRRAS